MRRVNGYNKIRDFRESEILKSFARNKVSNLKMDIDDTEKNPFGDWSGEYRGVDDETGEINEIERFPSSSSSDVVQKTQIIAPTIHRTYGETSFIEGIDEHTPLIQRENELNDSVDEIKRKFPNADTSKFASKIDEY